jgi:hypothetical protein
MRAFGRSFKQDQAAWPFTSGRQTWCRGREAGLEGLAVYWLSAFARDGGLLSYGVDQVNNLRRAATYVDRILRGEKPGDRSFRPSLR